MNNQTQSNTMDNQTATTIEAARAIFKALDKATTKREVLLTRVLFKRDEQGNLTEILMSYETKNNRD